jgi:hypothetical protein
VLEEHPAIGVRYARRPEELKEPDLIVLPGTKNTMDDLVWLRESGMEAKILQAADREGTVIVAAANHKGITLPLTGGSGIIVILITAAAGMALMVLLFVRESGQGRKNSREQV